MTDEMRLREIQWKLQQCQAVNEVLLIVYSTIGGPIQGLPSLSDRLKRMISVLLDGMHSSSVDFSFHLKSPLYIYTYNLLTLVIPDKRCLLDIKKELKPQLTSPSSLGTLT